jgi:membrane protein
VTFAKSVSDLLKETIRHWQADKAQRLGAALAYYAVIALPPILVIFLFIISLFYDSHAATTGFSAQINSLLGPKAGDFMVSLMSAPQIHSKGVVAAAIAVLALILTATGFFLELQSDLNNLWGVEQKADYGWRGLIVNRILCFFLMAAIGFLLLLSLVTSAGIAAAQKTWGSDIPGGGILWHGLDLLVSLVIVTGLFAMIFKLLPDVKIRWRDVGIGAAVTAFLFTIGKFLLGLYIGRSSVASPYGVAGSLVLILVWVYYSAQIFLFGAEFAQVYANSRGRAFSPSKHAQWEARGESAAENEEEMEIASKAAGQSRTLTHKIKVNPSTPSVQINRHTLKKISDQVHSWPPGHRKAR